MSKINSFTELSIQLATQKNYLDLLFSVYPLAPDTIRTIDDKIWNGIENSYKNGDNIALFRELLKLKLFPIKDGYVPFLRKYKEAVENNPMTVNRICGRIRELGIDKLYELCTTPKETNRQMGPLFQNWVDKGTLGMKPVDLKTFLANEENAILKGSDSELKKFCEEYLDFKRGNDKGPDFVCRMKRRYVIGEAKFLSDEGGHQNDQFLDAMDFINTDSNWNVTKIAVLDGVLYIPSKRKMYKIITSKDMPVMSALLLRDFLYAL